MIYCNTLVNMALDNIDCSNPVLPPEEGNQCSGYCSRVVNLGGFTLSEKVKTSGKGKVISYAEFKDNGKDIKQGFPGDLTDRIAPIPLSAEVRHIEDADLDSFVVTMSEPVRLVTTTYGTNALDFYMNSAVDETESSRYMSALTGTKVNATSAPALGAGANGTGRIRYIYERKDGGVYPQPGDYVRLGGNLSNVFWEDDTTGRNPLGSDTLRNVADAAYYWNSPTAYNETTRLPSPWISVVGETKLEYIPISFAHTSNVIVTDTTPSISVDAVPTLSTKREVAIAQGGRPGFWVKNTSIFQAFSALTDDEQQTVRDELANDPKSVYFSFDVQYFTNLGTYVAGKSGKIYCDDKTNFEKNKKYFFGGKNCLDDSEDFFIGWNMISDKGRAVGTGAYVTKIQSRVKLGSVKTDKKGDKTSVFGIKRSPLPNLDYMKSSSEE